MIKSFVWVFPAILFSLCHFSEGLECYHCYSAVKATGKGADLVPCNEANLTLSNSWICPNSNAKCIYEEVQVEATKAVQTWRTCSSGTLDPCDPNNLPPGMKMLRCSFCSTDKCNLQYKEKEKEKENTFTFNINANVNLYIRQ